MSLTFKKTGDEDYPRFLKILVQGPPKGGKTTFASTAPNPVFLAMPDAGLMSIAHKNVAYREIEDVQELHMIHTMLTDPSMRAKLARSQGMPEVETIVIDTLDSLQEMLKKSILKSNRATEMRQADWGKLKEQLSAIVKMYVALPLNVIFTVHTTTMQDDEQRLIQVPALQGAIKDEIAAWVDYSLLAERKREFDKDGKPKIVYVLKAEGDQKNPSLGNRAAGRIPEYIEPEFKVLRDAAFSGVDALLKTQTVEVEMAQPQVLAPSESQDEKQAPIPAATGTPTVAPDAHEHINSAGIKALTRSLTELNLSVPEFSQDVWTLGFARDVAKYIVACKADEKLGRGPAVDGVIEYLKGHDVNLFLANYVTMPAATAPAETPKKVVKAKAAAKEVVEAEAVEAADTTEETIAMMQEQVGAVVIGQSVSADAKCAECGNPVDDLEIANLATSRFRRPLCLKDYLAANKAAKEQN